MTLKVIVPPHPLIAHWLTVLRMSSTPPALYATGFEELGRWLTYEAVRDWLPNSKHEIKTFQTTTEGNLIEADIPLIVIPLLPCGLELWQGGRKVLPNSYLSLGGPPKDIKPKAGIIVFADQIASGERLSRVIDTIMKKNVESKRIRVITPLASNKGLTKIGEKFKDLIIYCGCIDPDLTEAGEISPGIGNPCLRLTTTIGQAT